MPMYEYECIKHGVFESLRPMSDCRLPQPCPCCGSEAPRVTITGVALAVMPAATRKAHGINETNRHAPKALSQARHGSGCSCCSGNRSTQTGQVSAAKSFVDRRPWMISH